MHSIDVAPPPEMLPMDGTAWAAVVRSQPPTTLPPSLCYCQLYHYQHQRTHDINRDMNIIVIIFFFSCFFFLKTAVFMVTFETGWYVSGYEVGLVT